MSYAGISIREALDKLNSFNGGWFLPQVQRQYVWGARHESETYICLLLDSLLRRYPIGGIVLWRTSQKVPHREFIGDYTPGQYAKQVPEGRWGLAKSLVYDGQQRLQTLFSVLRHRFNGRILHYDLLFDKDTAEADETGFLFRDPGVSPDPRFLSMIELSSLVCDDKQKIDLEDRVIAAAHGDPAKRLLIRKNISALWTTFVDENLKSIAYYSVQAETPKEVNEVFRRLNTGGVSLTQLELVLGKIKAIYSDYEERLWALSIEISKKSGGIEFPSTSILQFFHLLVKNTIRIDEDHLSDADISAFEHLLQHETAGLIEFFSAYLNHLFNINHASIIPRWQAILPIVCYLTLRQRAGRDARIRALPDDDLQAIHQYFLLSQFCDWNTQTMVNAFSREAMAAGAAGKPFPFASIRQIAGQKNRYDELHEYQLCGLPWFTTKVLMPHRTYVFHDRKPQIDHIFPRSLATTDPDYLQTIDIVWNYQPIVADVNNYKRAEHPRDYFLSTVGKKYWDSYDFIPAPGDPLWDNHKAFVRHRRSAMIDKMASLYGLPTIPTPAS